MQFKVSLPSQKNFPLNKWKNLKSFNSILDRIEWAKKYRDIVPLKVHKNENFFGSDFEICTFS